MVQQAVHSSYYCIRSCPMNQRKGGWKCAGKGALSSVKEFNTGPLYPDLVGEKATRFYGYQCTYGQHMTNSRLCTQMLSMRINFPFIHCFMSSKKWGLVFSETNSFRQCVYFVQHCSSNCFFFFLRAAALWRSFWVDVGQFSTNCRGSPLHQVGCIPK